MKKQHPIHGALSQGTLLFDGATGTYAASLEGFGRGPVETACLYAPEAVYRLHRAYLSAGCRLIKTNTFAAHPGMAVRDCDEQRRVIEAAFSIASRAAKEEQAFVFADIGPVSAQTDAAQAYIRASQCFLDAGADCFLFETMACAQGIEAAAAYIRGKKPEAFIAVCFAAEPDGYTRNGERAAELISQMDLCGSVDAVGLNCVCGAYHMRRLIERIGGIRKPLIAMPNAGYPHMAEGRMFYDSDPGYFAQQVQSCVSAGASIVGGCCGTTPAHIAQTARLLRERAANAVKSSAKTSPVEGECASRILSKLKSGRKVTLVELDPPRSAQLGGFIDGARRLCASGADAITIADCPIGRASMDSSILACKLQREYGIEAMPHMTCRDRNVNATKALLLGLSMEGVHNVLAVTGDPVPASDRGSVKGVFQFNSRVLARFVRSLCGSGEADAFFLCGALNVNAVNFDAELEKARLKEEAGMHGFLTQPVLSERAAENLHRAREVLSGYLFGGLFPVVSQKNARFLDSEVAGMSIDPQIIRAFEGLDRVQGEALAEKLCLHAASRIAQDVDGYYIMTPFQRIDLVRRIVAGIRS